MPNGLAEIAAKDKEDESIDALERLVNLYPENYLVKKLTFFWPEFMNRGYPVVYDQGATLKLNFYEDYIILYSQSPPDKHEQEDDYRIRLKEAEEGAYWLKKVGKMRKPLPQARL